LETIKNINELIRTEVHFNSLVIQLNIVINMKAEYTHNDIVLNPKTISDSIIDINGNTILNHLLRNEAPENNANAVIGATFGGCGINLNHTANNTNPIKKFSFLFIIYSHPFIV
jgi:hypothetical protein